MIPEIIFFSKSMSCRLQEFENLLSDIETPCSDVTEVWSSIFHEFVIPNCGWEALWLMSEESCMKYDVIHPTAVIVMVESYDWDDMAATVTVTGVQDDIVLPSKLDVPVIELHPIKNQDYDEYDLKVIADWLDKCRYFFKYLWYPWDAKRNVKISDWCLSHLENRLQIQCNIQNGVFNKNVAQYYKSLVSESRHINEDLTDISENDLSDLSDDQRMNVIKTYFRRKVLKMELELFEEPDLRNDLLLLRMGKNVNNENRKKEAKVIWEGGSIDTLLLHLSTVKSHIHNDIVVRVSPSLQQALDSSSSGDSLFLPPGSHVFNYLSGLESGGVIKGLGNANETTILPDISGVRRAILFGCFGDFELENLTISRHEGIAVQVYEKTLKISNCRLNSKKSSARGVIVLSGCTLVMENCQILGFGVGITLQKGSKAFISNTRISDCYVGMKIGEETEVSTNGVEISNCSESAVCLESPANGSDLPKSGDLDLLSDLGDNYKFSFESFMLKNNKKFNVVITNGLDGLASESFDADLTNETITISDEEDGIEPQNMISDENNCVA